MPPKKKPPPVPKGSHKMPDGSIMKDSDMNKKKPRKGQDNNLKEKINLWRIEEIDK